MARSNQRIVVFMCTDNAYRSRIAEVIFNAAATRMGLSWKAESRGLVAENENKTSSAKANSLIELLKAKGIKPEVALNDSPSAVTSEDLEQADRIVALEESVDRPLFNIRFPAWVDKVEYWHVDDSLQALDLIDREVMGLIARILTGGQRQGSPDVSIPNAQPDTSKAPVKKQITLKVGRETAGRKGKGVTTIFDTPFDEATLLDLAARLKQKCGTGGTVKHGCIEIQGDQRERIVAELEKMGYKVKRAGG